MAHTIRGTLATHPIPGRDQQGRTVTQLRIAITPQVTHLRRGERREDYIRVTTVYLTGALTHPVPVGAPVTVTGTTTSRPRTGRVTYWAAPEQFSWR
ncbi:hypothetical protein [Phytomonospora endophytica]|uniref:Uncharacterized protein n=1 Tax=Phytomonospora endophytica TaxID=714109 RepID=A0A841FWL1_9ACTN|nr:hypothetical protein [Phytomonospora endophytica]MBB6037727.1 hypothetical protein [Phytomonospora endophytica]GIG67745.1 hypothetical protein Pen01_40400 [Phytomonospora endophytica]